MDAAEPIIAKLNPGYLSKQKLSHTLMSLALTMYVSAIFIWYDYSGQKLTGKFHSSFSWNTELMNVIGIVLLWLLFVRLMFNKLNRNYRDYVINFDLHTIKKHSTGKVPIIIPYEKIVFVVQSFRNDYVLCDANARAVLIIPHQVDHNGAIGSLLIKNFAVVPRRNKFFGKAAFAIPYIFLAFTFTILTSRSALAASIISAIMVLVVSVSFYNSLSKLRAKNIKIRPSFFVSLIIPVAIVLIVLITKLFEF